MAALVYALPGAAVSVPSEENSCQEGWHRPALCLFTKVFDLFSCALLKAVCFEKAVFVQRSSWNSLTPGISNTTVRNTPGTRSARCSVPRNAPCASTSAGIWPRMPQGRTPPRARSNSKPPGRSWPPLPVPPATGTTAPAPAWQALAGAPVVRQRGRRNGKSN